MFYGKFNGMPASTGILVYQNILSFPKGSETTE